MKRILMSVVCGMLCVSAVNAGLMDIHNDNGNIVGTSAATPVIKGAVIGVPIIIGCVLLYRVLHHRHTTTVKPVSQWNVELF